MAKCGFEATKQTGIYVKRPQYFSYFTIVNWKNCKFATYHMKNQQHRCVFKGVGGRGGGGGWTPFHMYFFFSIWQKRQIP